MVVAIIITTFL